MRAEARGLRLEFVSARLARLSRCDARKATRPRAQELGPRQTPREIPAPLRFAPGPSMGPPPSPSDAPRPRPANPRFAGLCCSATASPTFEWSLLEGRGGSNGHLRFRPPPPSVAKKLKISRARSSFTSGDESSPAPRSHAPFCASGPNSLQRRRCAIRLGYLNANEGRWARTSLDGGFQLRGTSRRRNVGRRVAPSDHHHR